MPQDKFPLFSANFGDRLRWLRTQRGLSQAEIADGSASTASSWEKDGKMPRPGRWQGLAERLGLSWSFISTGNPSSAEDYEFIRKSRNLIEWVNAPEGVSEMFEERSGVLEEDQAPYGTPGMLRREIEQRHRDVVAAAGDDVARLGWILTQQRTHLSAPAHWEVAAQERPAEAPKKPLIVPAPAHQRNPVQPGALPSRKATG